MQLFYRIFRRRSPTKMARYFNDRPQLLIKVKQGVVRGIEQKLPNNGIVYCFKGIPYAEPPIGNLRFEVNGFDSETPMKYDNTFHMFYSLPGRC